MIKKIAFHLSILFITGLACIPVASGQEHQLREQIARIIHHTAAIDTSLVTGIVVCLADHGNSACFTYGQGVEESALFELGSLSKPVLAFLVQMALDSLQMDIAEPVCTFLPDSLCQGTWQQITIDQIIAHQAGLPRSAGDVAVWEKQKADPYQAYDVHRLARDIQSTSPIPGMYSYSHLGYAALRWLFEQVGGLEAFTEGIRSAGFLGRSMRWSCPDSLKTAGHGFDGYRVPPWHTNAMMPSLGLTSTALDFLRFIEGQSNGTLDTLRLTRVMKKKLAAFDRSGGYFVMQGWFVIRSGPSLVCYHTGRTGGHQVSAAFIPGVQQSVVVFSNGAAGSNELCLSILHMLRSAKNKRPLRH